MKTNPLKNSQLDFHFGMNLAPAKKQIEDALYALPHVESVQFSGWKKSYTVTISYGQLANRHDLKEQAHEVIRKVIEQFANRPKLKEYWDKLREWWNNYYITNREVALIVIIDIILTLLK